MPPPRRHRLPHGLPSWHATDCIVMINICATPRDVNQLCHPSVAAFVREAIDHHAMRGVWAPLACVLMPDHLHLLARVAATTDLQRLIVNLKRYVAREHHVKWQQDFFEHRLRAAEHFDSKAEYLRMNPVRARLVNDPDAWPYFYRWY